MEDQGNGPPVVELACNGQALTEQRARCGGVASMMDQPAGAVQRLHPRRRAVCGRVQRRYEPAQCLVVMAVQPPEPGQRAGQAQRRVAATRRGQAPVKRHTQVVVLDFQAAQDQAVFASAKQWFGLLRQLEEEAEMAIAGARELIGFM